MNIVDEIKSRFGSLCDEVRQIEPGIFLVINRTALPESRAVAVQCGGLLDNEAIISHIEDALATMKHGIQSERENV